MPELIFRVELPDGTTMECYSPSTIVRNHFSSGEQMPAIDFLVRSRKAFIEASQRVRAKYGFACSSASAQLHEIELRMQGYPPESTVRILSV
jgi:uncharacterized repeat protein (TIGR04042 family)